MDEGVVPDVRRNIDGNPVIRYVPEGDVFGKASFFSYATRTDIA